MSVSLSKQEKEELRKFILQENSQKILDNIKVIPNGDDLFLAYLRLRVTSEELKQTLSEMDVLNEPLRFLKEQARYKKMQRTIESVEDTLSQSPTFLQRLLRYRERILGEPFAGALEVLRDLIATQYKSKERKPDQAKTKRYVWRTQNDKDVRSAHAAREGLIFRYDEPPAGGNPGEDYGCRCWAEPLPDDWSGGLGEIFKK
ncbi:MAG: phage minor head protein [Pseudomonadota bacterium]